MSRRIGIYSGTFDPVHAGHITFALQAMDKAKLDRIYFLPERRPRNKQGVEHFGHRVAMLKRALRPHRRFGVLDLPDIEFSVQRTLPRLTKHFEGDQLVFLVGSDVINHLADWPNAKRLIKHHELVIGMRHEIDRQQIDLIISRWTTQPPAIYCFTSYAPTVSSGQIREALRRRERVQGQLESVIRYSNRHWLYVSLNS